MEQDLLDKINDSASKHFNGDISLDVRDRIATEMRLISDSGRGTLLAAAASLAEFSAAHGYPVGIRGHIGNLYIAHLLGLGAADPMELGLRYEGFLGLNGSRMQEITLNVAPELLNGLRAHLRELFPDCDVLFGPGVPSKKTVIVPRESGAYDPANEYLSITLCPHELMSRTGKAWRRSNGVDIFDEELIVSAYRADVYDIPVLGDLNDFQDLANMLEPKTFSELVKVVGLSIAHMVQFQAYRIPLLPDRFDHLVGTREDIYDICVRYGISGDDAFRIMQEAVRGELTQDCKDMLVAQGLPGVFMETLDAADCLYPRGQFADYTYWALMILAHSHRLCRV